MFDAERTKLSEFLGVGVVISHATIYKARAEEMEFKEVRKELEYLKNQVHYYKDTIEAISVLKENLLGERNNYKLVRDTFFKKVTDYQEETLLFFVSHKEILKWSENGARVVD